MKKIIPIKEYLLKMENYRKKNINDKCKEHSCKYVSYCLDCNCHLCEECLKSRSHINPRPQRLAEPRLRPAPVHQHPLSLPGRPSLCSL